MRSRLSGGRSNLILDLLKFAKLKFISKRHKPDQFSHFKVFIFRYNTIRAKSRGRNPLAKETWTLVKLINWTKEFFEKKGIENARLEAEVLLAYLLKLKRIELYTNYNRVLTEDELAEYKKLIQKRSSRYPTQYITGKTEFFSTELAVREGVLIPRPETEVLVEEAIKILSAPFAGAPCERILLDIGTGCGNIPIAILKHVPMLKVYATDISEKALELAGENARRYGFSRTIVFLKGDLFEPLANLNLEKSFDIIVSNPPYIAPEECENLMPEVRDFEPREALLSEEGGIFFHKKIVENADKFLKPAGYLLMECGASQAEKLKNILQNSNIYNSIESIKDYSGVARVVKARRSID